MKTTTMLATLVLGLMLCLAEVSKGAPMGTAFTYQGRLMDANGPADGLYDLQFKLFDDPCSGIQQGGTIDINDLDVIDGYFTVELDYGSNVFNGDARWLETMVARADGSDPCTLRPRHELTPTPYALHARWLLVDTNLDNVFLGESVGINTTGYHNQAIGNESLYFNTTGTLNSAVGDQALYSNTSGHSNVAMGHTSLYSNTDGNWNVAIGRNVLYFNSSGSWNSALGGGALSNNTTGNYNSAMGYMALTENTTGINNTAVGSGALYSNTDANENSAMGYQALYSNTTGNYNSAMGSGALYSNTFSNRNSAMGYQALYNNLGYRNSAMGYQALYSNISGYHNSAIGTYALWSNTSGRENSAMGNLALYRNTTGIWNSAFGDRSLKDNTTGVENSAAGVSALERNETGSGNSAMGAGALGRNITGNYNTAVGHKAIASNREGSRNTVIGYHAGNGEISDPNHYNKSGNVFIGYEAGYNETGDDKLYIANGSEDNNVLIYGDFASGNIGIGTVSLNTHRLRIKQAVSNDGYGLQLQNADASKSLQAWVGISGAVIDAEGTADLQFQTGGVNRMFIANSGNVGIGTTSLNAHRLRIKQASSNDGYGLQLQNADASRSLQAWVGTAGAVIDAEGTADLQFLTGGVNRIFIENAGNVGIGTTSPATRLHVAGGCITGSMCSDIRLKKNIEPLPLDDSILDRVMGLQAVTFQWKHRDDGKRQIGLIAQDVEEVFPEVVTTPDDGTCEKGLLATGMDAVLVEAIKELKVENESLKDRIEALERIIQQHQFAVAKDVQ